MANNRPVPDTPSPIFLLTDFGSADHYVAAMKAVILGRAPAAPLVDISHHVIPQGIAQGCYLLESLWPWLPPGAIVLAVVDPGVGTTREGAVFSDGGRIAIGPNNGLFGFLPPETPGRVLDKPEFWAAAPSYTFHGRDIFAPCAAHLAAGGVWSDLGVVMTSPVILPHDQDPAARRGRSGRIVHFDHFGNAITTIAAEELNDLIAQRQSQLAHETIAAQPATAPPAAPAEVSAEVRGKVRCPVGKTFADAEPGQPIAYAGSTGRLEIAVRNGSAREKLGLKLDDVVTLAW